MHYLVSLKECGAKQPHTIPRGESAEPKSGEGWRSIGESQIWFESAWHANYARFLDRHPETIVRWQYKLQEFCLGPFGLYGPTFCIEHKQYGPCWLELDSHMDGVRDKALVFEIYRPKEQVFVIDREEFLKKARFFRETILGWE